MTELTDTFTTFVRRVVRFVRRKAAELRPVRHDVEIVGGQRGAAFVAALVARCENDGLPFTTGGLVDERRPRLHFRERDADRACATVEAVVASLGITVEFRTPTDHSRVITRLSERWRTHGFTSFDVHVVERTTDTGDDRYRFLSVVEVDLWHADSTSFKGGTRYASAPRYNDVTTALRWETLDELTGAAGDTARVDLDAWHDTPDLYARDFPIDIVYTWVDDKDPNWVAVKHRFDTLADATSRTESRRDMKERYRNRDELRYSLRSLEMFAPFVQHIYLVTMGQVPDWLDTDHPQISVVDHRDIYADPTALPTFNSSSIETQLHHIDGLAEHFIYFNDDVFLGRPCNWSDFFHANGVAKFFTADHTIAAADIPDDVEEYLIADRNAIRLMQKEFGFTVHRPMAHVPHTARKSVLYELEERFRHDFDACQSERFRSVNDLRPIAFMGHHYGFFTGRAVPDHIDHRYLALWKPTIASQLDGVLRSRGFQCFCINDVGVQPERELEVDRLVQRFLSRYFPYPSRFERT